MPQTTVKTRKRPALDRVVRTADRLFYERGLHATGVDTIAAEAEVSKATMYTYFPTKDELIAEYLRRRSSEWRGHVSDILGQSNRTPREQIVLVFELLGEWFAADDFNGCPFINAEAECGSGSPAHSVNVEHREWVRLLFDRLLREAGIAHHAQLTLALVMLYDGCMVGAHVQPEVGWAAAAEGAAAALVGGTPGS